MELNMRPAAPVERFYAYEQSLRIAERCGNPGCLYGKPEQSNIKPFFLWDQMIPAEDTPAFKTEFKTVCGVLRVNMRYGPVLTNRMALMAYCHSYPQAGFRNGYEYAFRADTEKYSYLIRCVLRGDDGDSYIYIYLYRRECLERHMEQAEKGICFMTPQCEELFRVSDGDMIRTIGEFGSSYDRMVRYVDDCHAEIGGSFYSIREFAESLERGGSKVIPLRSSLPERCFSVTPGTKDLVIIEKGGMSHCVTGTGAVGLSARENADIENKTMGVSKAQEAAMLAGAMFGWDTPAADPKNYDGSGHLIMPGT